MPPQKVTAEDEELAPQNGLTSKLQKVIKKKSNATTAAQSNTIYSNCTNYSIINT